MAIKSTTDKVFEANSCTIHELFLIDGGITGFRIPEFQRPYEWKDSNIQRLIEDILTGLFWCKSDDGESLTFIGTIITVIEQSKERDFNGNSLSVIDGQQRLTTISLLSTVLMELMSQERDKIGTLSLPIFVSDWLESEIQNSLIELQDLVFGDLKVSGGYIKFPRIVRESLDYRSKTKQDIEYRSVIANYLNLFSGYIENNLKDEFVFSVDKNNPESQKIKSSVKYLKSLLDFSDFESELSNSFLLKDHFPKKGVKNLFKRSTDEESQKLLDRIFSFNYLDNLNTDTFFESLRMLAFSNYLLHSVHITLVQTGVEKYAFDIFDSLNTTGEPLSAIQTLKPRVIKFENERKKYPGSESKMAFDLIEKYIESNTSSSERQIISKELVITFSLYFSSTRVGNSLNEQRRYLNYTYSDLLDNGKIRFVGSLKDVVDYRQKFWNRDEIDKSVVAYPESDILSLCLKFLYDLKNSLTIPLLTRYYIESEKQGKKEIFSEAVKAISAFVVLRRAYTGNTKNIDGDLRDMMARSHPTQRSATPFCVGKSTENPFIEIDDLKLNIRAWLNKGKGGISISNMEDWINETMQVPIYEYPKIGRFILIAAYHNSRPKTDDPIFLQKDRPSLETAYLNGRIWDHEGYSTLEHIAPQRPRDNKGDWDEQIYNEFNLTDTIGNLTMLPEAENQSAANRAWSDKRKLYKAFSSTRDEVELLFKEASREKFQFSSKNKKMINEGFQLPILKSVISVSDWNADHIKMRSRNLLELAWVEIFEKWLGDNRVEK